MGFFKCEFFRFFAFGFAAGTLLVVGSIVPAAQAAGIG